MANFIYTDDAKEQIEKIPVLENISRNVNLGDLLTFNKFGRPIFGLFNGFTERNSQVFVELRDGTETMYIHPKEIIMLHAGNGYANSYCDRGRQGGISGQTSI